MYCELSYLPEASESDQKIYDQLEAKLVSVHVSASLRKAPKLLLSSASRHLVLPLVYCSYSSGRTHFCCKNP